VIDFRYHVISIVAIFLALATGIALGAGPLRGEFTDQLARQADKDREDKEELRAELTTLQDQSAFVDDVAGLAGDPLVQGKMTDRSVALFTLPGASDDDVAAVADQVDAAGGTVTATVALQPAMLDPANRQLAEGLATSVLAEIPDVAGTDGASSYQLVGISLARAFLTKQSGGEAVDSPSRTIVQGYTEADFLSTDGDVERRAQLAVVVSGEPSDEAVSGQDELVATLTQSLDAGSGGVVMTGPTSAAETDGYVAAIRDSDASESVSTVDSVDTQAGQVVTVLALAQQAGGGVGQYGAVDVSETDLADLITP
jgi:hypothetical protein